MWPNLTHAATNEAEESSSHRGRKVVASYNDGDGSDGGDKWQSKWFIVRNMFTA
jgi:hypothetical protein